MSGTKVNSADVKPIIINRLPCKALIKITSTSTHMPSHCFFRKEDVIMNVLWGAMVNRWVLAAKGLGEPQLSETSNWTKQSTQHLSAAHSRIIFFQSVRKRRCKVGWLVLTVSVRSGIYFTLNCTQFFFRCFFNAHTFNHRMCYAG